MEAAGEVRERGSNGAKKGGINTGGVGREEMRERK